MCWFPALQLDAFFPPQYEYTFLWSISASSSEKLRNPWSAGTAPFANLSPFVIWAVSAALSVWVSHPHEMHLSILNAVLVYANDILCLSVRPQFDSFVFSLDQGYCFTGHLKSGMNVFCKGAFQCCNHEWSAVPSGRKGGWAWTSIFLKEMWKLFINHWRLFQIHSIFTFMVLCLSASSAVSWFWDSKIVKKLRMWQRVPDICLLLERGHECIPCPGSSSHA